jgi:hypothetical protein
MGLAMRWAILGLVAGCGSGTGGGDVGEPPGDPFTAVFLLNADRNGDTVVRGQIGPPGSLSVVSGTGCSNPLPADPISLAQFLPSGSADLIDIGDVGIDGLGGIDVPVIARTVDDTNHDYALVREDVPYPDPGSTLSVWAEDDRFAASLVIGDPPTVTSPAPGSTFTYVEDLHMTIEAPGAAGIVVDMDFPNDARAVCFFPAGGDIAVTHQALSGDIGPNDDTTFGITGTTYVSVGSWTTGQGGSDGVDVHLVSISSTTIELALQ